MQITVTTESGGVFPLEVSGELRVEDLKGLLEIETGVKVTAMLLIHNMAPMTDDWRTLSDYKVEEDDIVMVTELTGPITTSNPSPLYQPSTSGAGATVGSQLPSAHGTTQVGLYTCALAAYPGCMQKAWLQGYMCPCEGVSVAAGNPVRAHRKKEVGLSQHQRSSTF